VHTKAFLPPSLPLPLKSILPPHPLYGAPPPHNNASTISTAPDIDHYIPREKFGPERRRGEGI